MALIGTLRTKMTKVVVGLVALAMGAFIVGGDLFGNGPRSVFGGEKNSIGEINGHNISQDEFLTYLRDRETSYQMNFGRQPGDREQTQLRQEAWELLILKYAITPQFEKVGESVTSEEEWDMVQGKNMDANIKQSFTDSTGTFDRNRLITWMQSLDKPENQQYKGRWDLFRASLVPGRARVKYENLLIKTNFVTDAEAERDYHNQNDVAEIKYLFIPYFAVSDSTVKVSDGDAKDYYNKNIEHYKTDQTRSLSYVTFPVIASREDTAAILLDLNKTAEEFKAAADDSSYAAGQTDGKEPYAKYNISTLPKFLTDDKSKLVAGTVIGPFLTQDGYSIVKVVKAGSDTTYTARASHILIKWENETPEAKKTAKAKAQGILNDIKKGANFGAKAMEFGSDGTSSKGGDLGYFKSGQMVKPFQTAVFNAKKTGVLPELVETQFGYHIIEVTAIKDNTSYTVATIERTVVPSDATRDAALSKAGNFLNDVSNVDAFKAKAKKENLSIFDANDLSTSERRIGNLGEARSVVTWLYKDASVGKVSEVFTINDNYVVAVMTASVDEGHKPFEKVKEEIIPIVKNQLKSKSIIEKLNAQKGSLDEIAKAFGNDAVVKSMSDLKENSSQLPTVGFDPVAVGVAFSLDNGKRSKPFAGENGVLIIEMQSKTTAPAVGEYSMFKNQLEKTLNGNVSFNIGEAMKEASNIKDKRYKFY